MSLPHALRDWLPEEYLAYFVRDTVDALDLLAFHARYAAGGSHNEPFNPAMMVEVLVNAYQTGVGDERRSHAEGRARAEGRGYPGLRDKHGKVAMVGMANATVGIAMGAAGSDVALETADVPLVAGDLVMQFQVRLEEAFLREQHGATYAGYCGRVRRWL